ncbi:MAG: DUF1670 domain-containing protein, partial [Bacillota bacterium]
SNFIRNGRGTPTKVRLTPFAPEDLDLELEMGLTALQVGRMLRLIEEAYAQDALLSAKQIGMLCNLTPTALRNRLQTVRKLGIWVPIQGLGRDAREQGGMLRSTWAMARHLAGEAPGEIRQAAAISRERWREIKYQFGAVARHVLGGGFQPSDLETASWVELIRRTPRPKLELLMQESPASSTPNGEWADFCAELTADFGLAPVKVRAVRELLEELRTQLAGHRADQEVVYWAVAATEPAGKPLEACRLVPVRLTFLDPEDVAGETPNRVSGMKFAKLVRYATQAKFQGGYITYADLGYLLGIHTEAIRRLIRAHPKLVVPLRGQECDIGRGVTHRRKIVELYLQLYTETEIVSRTGHSYESIENYIKEFAAVLVMAERGMGPTLIRRVMGRSLKLVEVYLDLVREYAQPEYAFRLQHLRQLFLAHEGEVQKRGLVP